MNIYGRHGIPLQDKDKFIKDFNELYLEKKLAKKYGVSVHTIGNWKREYGLSRIGKSGPRKIIWKEQPSGCWRCVSHKMDGNGYPGGNRKAGRRSIVRVLYEQKYGLIKLKVEGSHGVVMLHRCDNRWCINPDHVRPATQNENLEDARIKGRNAKWERAPNVKLTREDVRLMRSLKGKMSLSELGKMFGVDPGTVWPALHEKTWKNIDDEVEVEKFENVRFG